MGKVTIKKTLFFIISTASVVIFILNVRKSSKSSVSVGIMFQAERAPSTLLQRVGLGLSSTELRSEKIDGPSASSVRKKTDKFYNRTESPPVSGLQLISGYNETTRINGVFLEGKLNSSRSYAVFSATTENIDAQDYMFYLPLTTLAWNRIEFNSIIILAGSSNKFFYDPLIRYVVSRCLELDALIIRILSPTANTVTISQVGRLYAANILSAAFADIDLVYLITSDADLWPIDPDAYRLRSDMVVLALNSDCCQTFSHRGANYNYRMLPMSNIGMRVITWNKIIEQNSTLPKSSQEILDFLCREFGQVALQPALKGDNKGWYLDQMAISVMMKNWTEQYGINRVMLIPREIANDRIDRSDWRGDSSLLGKIDAHMPLKAFSPDIWRRITPLLKSMYGYNSERYN